MGKGLIVAESISPVGSGTAGLLLMKGIPLPPPLSGINVGTVTIGVLAALPPGAGAGGSARGSSLALRRASRRSAGEKGCDAG